MQINQHAKWTDSVCIYPDYGTGRITALSYVGLKLAGEVGEVVEHIGKAMRDDRGIITEERKKKIAKEIGDVYWYLARVCRDLRIDPSQVLDENYDKLNDRKDRNVLGGSGDDR